MDAWNRKISRKNTNSTGNYYCPSSSVCIPSILDDHLDVPDGVPLVDCRQGVVPSDNAGPKVRRLAEMGSDPTKNGCSILIGDDLLGSVKLMSDPRTGMSALMGAETVSGSSGRSALIGAELARDSKWERALMGAEFGAAELASDLNGWSALMGAEMASDPKRDNRRCCCSLLVHN